MELVKATPYKCDICGKVSPWVHGQWAHYIFPYDMRSDLEFDVCSDYCYRILANMNQKNRIKLYLDILKAQE